MFNKTLLITAGIIAAFSLPVQAHFFIDNQGLDKQTPISVGESRARSGEPNGYSLLTDNTFAVVHQIGKGSVKKITSYGSDLPLKDAMMDILPIGFAAYVESDVDTEFMVSWAIKSAEWTEALGQIGASNGYRFIVQWPEKIVQIVPDTRFTKVDDLNEVMLRDPGNRRTIRIYTDHSSPRSGALVKEGVVYPMVIVE